MRNVNATKRTGEDNAAIHNVGGKFRRGLFKSDAHGLDDAVHLFGNGLADFLRGDDDVLRDAGHEIAALDLDLLRWFSYRLYRPNLIWWKSLKPPTVVKAASAILVASKTFTHPDNDITSPQTLSLRS